MALGLTGLPVIGPSRIPLPAPLCSARVTARHRSYGRSDSCAAALRLYEHEHRPCPAQVSLRHAHCRHDHSVSNHHAAPWIASARYPSASTASFGPAIGYAASLVSRGSGLRHLSAGSPASQAESSSQSLRTGRSLPVALHPLSQGRSYLPFQAGERMPEEDLHLSDQTRLWSH